MTIASENYIYVTGDIAYQNANTDILGLVATNAVWVWNPMNSSNSPIFSAKNRRIDAAILSVAHTFQVQNYSVGGNRGTLTINGAIAQKFRGPVGLTGGVGYIEELRVRPTVPLPRAAQVPFAGVDDLRRQRARRGQDGVQVRRDGPPVIAADSSLWMATFVIVAAGVFGLAIGSFLNVVAYRVPAGRSIVSPPSACPNCGDEIRPYDNIPVLSWLVLRGKCRGCREPISLRYPLVEAATGIFFGVVALEVLAGPDRGRHHRTGRVPLLRRHKRRARAHRHRHPHASQRDRPPRLPCRHRVARRGGHPVGRSGRTPRRACRPRLAVRSSTSSSRSRIREEWDTATSNSPG